MNALGLRAGAVLPLSGRRALRLVERNLMAFRHTWIIIVSGFAEPILYLLGIGYGVGGLLPPITTGGATVSYAQFVAPALMAASAMNGGIYETTFNLFFKLKYAKLYDTILATPLGVADIALGEVTFAVMRGTAYAAAFALTMTVLGLQHSWWGVLSIPAAVLVVFAFGSAGLAATTWVRSWQDFDAVQLVLLPLFLFSGTFYPLSTYPALMQNVVLLTPLYHGVHLIRELTLAGPDLGCLVDVLYFAAMSMLGLAVATRRLTALLLR